MNTKHTPGPWIVIEKGLNEYSVPVFGIDQHEDAPSKEGENFASNIAEVYGDDANAKLIAAAPELLEVLVGVKESFHQYANHRKDKGTANAKLNAWNNLVFQMDEVDRAIKKATA